MSCFRFLEIGGVLVMLNSRFSKAAVMAALFHAADATSGLPPTKRTFSP